MTKEEFRLMEREYVIWLDKHPKGDYSYRSFSHMRRTLEFAKHWNEKQINQNKDEQRTILQQSK